MLCSRLEFDDELHLMISCCILLHENFDQQGLEFAPELHLIEETSSNKGLLPYRDSMIAFSL